MMLDYYARIRRVQRTSALWKWSRHCWSNTRPIGSRERYQTLSRNAGSALSGQSNSHSRFHVKIRLTEREICLRRHPGGGSAGEFLTLKRKVILNIECLKRQFSRFTLRHSAGKIYARQQAVSTAQSHLSPGLCDSR
jgi:hypothetical protein